MALEHEEITEQIVGAAFEVHSVLGAGRIHAEPKLFACQIRVRSVFDPWLFGLWFD